jgi:hypothetical protein
MSTSEQHEWARVLAELCCRDLVPALWMPSLDDRALRERLRRRTHLVRLRASAVDRRRAGRRRPVKAVAVAGLSLGLEGHASALPVPLVFRRAT